MTVRVGWFAPALMLALGGCITPLPEITQSRSGCRTDPGGWCDFVREAAGASYGYAMLSSNAYRDEDTYVALPLAFEPRRAADNDGSGLAYSVFDRFEVADGRRGRLAARVIAFRGTEFGSVNDLFAGSLGESQRLNARAILQAERASLAAEGRDDVVIEVTGHSLGGALATQLSIENPDLVAVVFNTSPFFSGDPSANDTRRRSISERGEFLRVLRRYKSAPAAEQVVINCNPSSTAASKHSIRALGDCLTWIAAYDDPEAHRLVRENAIAKPEVECGEPDKVHPGPRSGAGPVAACVHAARTAAARAD